MRGTSCLPGIVVWLVRNSVNDWRLSMHVSAAHEGSEPMVKQEESNGKLLSCVHCQESDNSSLSSPRVVLDLMVLFNPLFYDVD